MKKVHPPKLARRLLRLLISEPLFDDFDGDLTELFWEREEAKGTTAAKLHYYKDVLLSARNIDLKRKFKFHKHKRLPHIKTRYPGCTGRP
mgnify:CR=1 FL=1